MRNLIDILLRRKAKPQDKNFVLVLQYKETPIGRLWLEGGEYCFQYDTAFESTALNKLPDFPEIRKIYKSPVLFPFFEMRIPSLKRGDIVTELARVGLSADATDMEMLSKFGGKTTSDPYVLKVDTKA